jgi:hypothetical protein
VGQVEARLGMFRNIPLTWKSFWAHPMVVLGDVGQVEARFDQLVIVLNLTQDRCIVCAEGINGSEIILDTPDYTPT